jgi:predicted RNA-binding Zn-ribbon protein involved in translation (DUF1610 family)
MKKIKCPKCLNETIIDIAKAVDENGEEFICKNCGYIFRYAL